MWRGRGAVTPSNASLTGVRADLERSVTRKPVPSDHGLRVHLLFDELRCLA